MVSQAVSLPYTVLLGQHVFVIATSQIASDTYNLYLTGMHYSEPLYFGDVGFRARHPQEYPFNPKSECFSFNQVVLNEQIPFKTWTFLNVLNNHS